jgi:hypothetical protein
MNKYDLIDLLDLKSEVWDSQDGVIKTVMFRELDDWLKAEIVIDFVKSDPEWLDDISLPVDDKCNLQWVQEVFNEKEDGKLYRMTRAIIGDYIGHPALAKLARLKQRRKDEEYWDQRSNGNVSHLRSVQ